MTKDRNDRVLQTLVVRLASVANVDERELSNAEIVAVGQLDVFGGAMAIGGVLLDSLALTEVLIGIEEELGLDNLLDDDRADSVRTLSDIVDLVVDRLPPVVIDAWLEKEQSDLGIWKR